MSKTRKHKPSSRKIRKHKPTRKQTGGVCCKYEKATEGQGCDGTPYKRGNELIRTFKSPTGNPAEFANIGFEPIWFNNGKPFFTTWKNIKFGLTYHSLKHTENLGTTCYDIENLMEVIKKMIPNLNWTRNATNKKVQRRRKKGYDPGIRKIFNPKDDFKTFYYKLEEAPYCVGPSGCLYYSTPQKEADITVCNGYYILKNPTSMELEIGKRQTETKKVELSKKVVDVAAIKLTFIRFLNKNQGGGDLDKFKEVDSRFEYKQTLFLYKIEVLDKTNWENQQKILLGAKKIAQVQQVLINNASDCNKDPESRNNWIKTENGRKRNPRLFLNPWHGINVIKNTQNKAQYHKLITMAFKDMRKTITNVQTAVGYFSDPYDIFPPSEQEDAIREQDILERKAQETRARWEADKYEDNPRSQETKETKETKEEEEAKEEESAVEKKNKYRTKLLSTKLHSNWKETDQVSRFTDWRLKNKLSEEDEQEIEKKVATWDISSRARNQKKKHTQDTQKKRTKEKKRRDTEKTITEGLRKDFDMYQQPFPGTNKPFWAIEGSWAVEKEHTSSIDGAICNNPYLKNKKRLEELKKDLKNTKKTKSKEEHDRALQAAALEKKVKAQKKKRPCWYQFLDSLNKLKWDQIHWDDWPEEIKENDDIFKSNNSQDRVNEDTKRPWTDQNVATRFCTIFLFTGRKLIENFKILLLEFPNFLSPKTVKITNEDKDEDEDAEEIAENIGKGLASFKLLSSDTFTVNEIFVVAYEKFIKDNLKLINIWNTGVRWVIDILDNPCEGWLRRWNDMEWKDKLNEVLPLSFINYWKKVDSLCEGEIKGYPKVTKKIINKITTEGFKSADYLFEKEKEERRRRRELKEEEEEEIEEEEEEEKTKTTISQSTEPWSDEEEEKKTNTTISQSTQSTPSLNRRQPLTEEEDGEEDGVEFVGALSLDQRLEKGKEGAIVIDGGGKKTRKKKMHRTKRSNRKTKRKKRKTKRRTKRKTKRRRRKRKHKRTRKR